MSKYRITLEGKTYEMEIELVPEETAPRLRLQPGENIKAIRMPLQTRSSA